MTTTTEVAGPDRDAGHDDVDPWSAPGSMADLRDSGVRR